MKKQFVLFGLVSLSLMLGACATAASTEASESIATEASESIATEVSEPIIVEAREPAQIGIVIEMSEFAFSPNDIELHVGDEVTFTLINVGQIEHELMIGRETTPVSGAPLNFNTDMFEYAGVEPMVMLSEIEDADDHVDADEHDEADEHLDANEDSDDHGDLDPDSHGGFMIYLPKGDQTATITFTVTEKMIGEWELGCFLMDGAHYTSGMYGSLTVRE